MIDERRFTFINKDASNIDTREHMTSATSHAQSVTWSLRQRKKTAKRPKRSLLNKRLAARKRDDGVEVFVPVPSDNDSTADCNGLTLQKPMPNRKHILRHEMTLSDPASDSILHEQLDPFLSLAGPTNLYDRNLLHYYLITTPTNLYGTDNTSLYCPVRERTMVFVQRSSVWLQCVLLSAEVYKLDCMAIEDSISVLYRKTLLYRSVREDLSNPNTRHSDSTIDRIMMTAVAENRIGYPSTGAQKHLAIAKGLIHERGDWLKRMPITFVMVLLWLGTGPGAFPDSSTFEAAISTFNTMVLTFIRPDQEKPDAGDINCWRDQLGLLNTYTQVRQQAFGSASPLRPFVEARSPKSLVQTRSHVAILWILNRILWDMRNERHKSIAFLSRLCYMVANSGSVHLKPLTILFIIMDCVSRMGVPVNEQNHNITDVMLSQGLDDQRIRWCWETVDAVEIMLLLTEDSRQNVISVLSATLIKGNLSGVMTAGPGLAEVTKEARLAWSSGRGDVSS